MPTPRETILAGPRNLAGLTGIVKVDALFANFCDYGRTANWKYVGTALKANGSSVTHDDILNGTNLGIVYCEALVYALRALVEQALAGAVPVMKNIDHDPCLLKPGYKCIDPNVVGNVRNKNSGYGDRKQCLFTAKHTYLQVGGSYYDPCFCTKYIVKGEPIESEGFLEPSKYKYPMLEGFRISKSPFRIFKPIWTESPAGFNTGFIQLDPDDLSDKQLEQANAFCKEYGVYGLGQRIKAK